MEKLEKLFFGLFNHHFDKIIPLSGAGSNRKYYRIHTSSGNPKTVIGVIGTSSHENHSFCYLAKVFKENGINVPRVYGMDDVGMRYIQEDLGDESLYSLIAEGRNNNGNYNDDEKRLISRVISDLPTIQHKLNCQNVFDNCYPMQYMDERSVMFDLNYFKYCFLKLSGVEFNEIALQNDFERLADDLLKVEEYGFQYRDFQPRNILVNNNNPYYIDFQGGRRGPIYYDLASFLWQASSRFHDDFRNEMIDVYINASRDYFNFDKESFKKKLDMFVLFRTLQVLGAYGFRGIWEKKKHFIDSIPMALSNLNDLINKGICDKYTYLKDISVELFNKFISTSHTEHNIAHELLKNDASYYSENAKPLVVRVFSFSYKKGIPQDESGNGGGYVFDCRSTHNPGRYEQYKTITGLDQPVIDFLEQDGEIVVFMDSVYKLADFHVNRFMERGFTNLMFSFGCTGGQHRSVYCAQHLAEHINEKFGVEVRLCHREQGINKVLPNCI